jgi:hypothetical protein
LCTVDRVEHQRDHLVHWPVECLGDDRLTRQRKLGSAAVGR